MFTVPLALIGAMVSLWYFDQTMNIFSQIGVIMLIGLVSKNGILIVEFANQRKAMGEPMLIAVKNAAVARFRPILMTSLSTVLGILPMAIATGAGAESRVAMGDRRCRWDGMCYFLVLVRDSGDLFLSVDRKGERDRGRA